MAAHRERPSGHARDRTRVVAGAPTSAAFSSWPAFAAAACSAGSRCRSSLATSEKRTRSAPKRSATSSAWSWFQRCPAASAGRSWSGATGARASESAWRARVRTRPIMPQSSSGSLGSLRGGARRALLPSLPSLTSADRSQTAISNFPNGMSTRPAPDDAWRCPEAGGTLVRCTRSAGPPWHLVHASCSHWGSWQHTLPAVTIPTPLARPGSTAPLVRAVCVRRCLRAPPTAIPLALRSSRCAGRVAVVGTIWAASSATATLSARPRAPSAPTAFAASARLPRTVPWRAPVVRESHPTCQSKARPTCASRWTAYAAEGRRLGPFLFMLRSPRVLARRQYRCREVEGYTSAREWMSVGVWVGGFAAEGVIGSSLAVRRGRQVASVPITYTCCWSRRCSESGAERGASASRLRDARLTRVLVGVPLRQWQRP